METFSQKLCYFTFGAKIPLFLQYILPAIILFNPLSKIIKSNWSRIILISLPFIFYFLKLLRNNPFFFSDDFTHLYLVSNFSYVDIFKMAMSPQGIWVGHKIIFGFYIFKLFFELFGTNPIPYYWLMFFINLGNGILFYFLASKILLSKKVSALIAFIFGFFYITWLSNIHEVLALMFTLAMFICFLTWSKKFNIKTFLFSIVLYILAIFTKEITFLAVPAMFLITVALKRDIKKNFKYLLIFFIIFVLYSLFYARGFTSYFDKPYEDGYTMLFSFSLIFQNLKTYLNQIFPSIPGNLLIPFVLVTFIIFDLVSKKLKSLPFLISYTIFLFPALLFINRTSTYYNYIPLVFLLIGFGVIIEGILKATDFIKSVNLKKIVIVSLLIFFALGLFRLNLKAMDSCFLIQYPWKNDFKNGYLKLINNIDKLGEEGKLKKGLEIKITPGLGYSWVAMENDILKVFLGNLASKRYTYSYNSEKGVFIVQ